MIKNIVLLLLTCSALTIQGQNKPSKKAPYKNASLTIDERVNDLLPRMTIEEKVGQLLSPLGWKMYEKTGDKVQVSEHFRADIAKRHIGMLWGFLRADPWTKKTLKTGLNPSLAAKATNNALQKYAKEETRLGIPIFLAEESMHGHMGIGATVFPTAIGQASTWDVDLLEEMAKATAKELRAQGAHIGYGPILDLAREPRWSRVEETFGEDPYLVSKMGKAVIKGFQGEGISNPDRVLSTLKHFAAYGVSEGGHNGAAVHLGERELFQSYLFPFKEAIATGALSVMTAYSSIDGIPSTSHKYLLQDVLKDKWGFKGYVVSDLGSIEGLLGDHKIVSSNAEAAALSLNSGVDVDLGSNAFQLLIEEVKKGNVSTKRIDEAVARVLRLKFEMGLFDTPYVDENQAIEIVRSTEHKRLARKVAQKSIVLLKNEAQLLPLSKNLKTIAVIGPNAHNTYNQLGDYTAPQDPEHIITVLEGIQNKLPNAKVNYVKGTAVRDTTQTDINAAVAAAKNAEVAVVVLGGSSARDFKTEYLETGAATVAKTKKEEIIGDMESGEGYDRATLDLMGKQNELLQAVVATGTPTVVIFIKGRPLLINWPMENAKAVLDAWYPGEQGGNAIADVLFGDYNPAGRLPVSIPRSVGQLPVYYNNWNPARRDYVEETAKPLLPFGYGLSYTQFKYSNLEIAVSQEEELAIKCTLTLQNTGEVAGEEVVQVYVKDLKASTVQPLLNLRGFKRVALEPGEVRQLTLWLSQEDLAVYTSTMDFVVEAGTFKVMIGGSSEDIRLEQDFEIVNSIKVE